MKKAITISFYLFCVMNLSLAQEVKITQIPREHVFMEVFSGTCCVWLFGVETAINEIIQNGDPITIVRHDYCISTDGKYENANGFGRFNYYALPGDPAAIFNGTAVELGGSTNYSKYDDYAWYFEQMINQMTSFDMQLEVERINAQEYLANVTLINLDPQAAVVPMTLQLALTADKINTDSCWAYQFDYFNCVQLGMYPDYQGTPIDFNLGSTQSFQIPINIEPGMPSLFCHVTAFLQKNSTRAVVQDKSVPIVLCFNDLDADLVKAANVPKAFCEGTMLPEIKIRNGGSNFLNSLNINFEINDSLISTFLWNGNLGFNETEIVVIPEITFDAEAINDINIYCSNPNGMTDQNPQNDTIIIYQESVKNTEMMVKLYLTTDNHPEETTWKIIGPDGLTQVTGGPYNLSNHSYVQIIYLSSLGCHKFIIEDAGGNGMTNNYALRTYTNGNWTTINSNEDFFSMQTTHFITTELKPSSDFTVGNTQVCEGDVVQFYENASGTVENFLWYFEGGDPQVSNLADPQVTYFITGIYDVMLIVQNDPITDTMLRHDFITVSEYPQAGFLEIPSQCINWPPLLLTQGYPEGGSYSGNFVENGYFYPDQAGPGLHQILYSFTNEFGCMDTASQVVYVDACVGINEYLHEVSLICHPNPVSAEGSLIFIPAKQGFLDIEIFGMMSTNVKLFSGRIENSVPFNINLKPFKLFKGVYMIRIVEADKTSYQKIIIN
jgi:PKD repeat protein